MQKWWIVVAICVLCGISVQAQDTEWTVYARYMPYGIGASQFDSEGNALEDLMPVFPPHWQGTPAQDQIVMSQFEISPSRRYIAYTLANSDLTYMFYIETPYQENILVYDLTTQSFVIEYALAPYDFVGNLAFDETTGQIVATVYHLSVVTDETVEILPDSGAEMSDRSLTLLTFDLNAGSEPTATLADETFQALYFQSSVRINEFREGSVAFSVRVDGGDAATSSAYLWNTATLTLTPDPRFTLSSDFFPPTGEVIRAEFNPDYPMVSQDGNYFQRNMIEVWDAAQSVWRPFYHEDDRSLSAWFVQNGERILVAASDAERKVSWLLLERDGTLVEEIPQPQGNIRLLNLVVTPDGFLYPRSDCSSSETSCTVFMEVNTRDGLDKGEQVMFFDGDYEVILFQAAQPLMSEYLPWEYLPPFEGSLEPKEEPTPEGQGSHYHSAV